MASHPVTPGAVNRFAQCGEPPVPPHPLNGQGFNSLLEHKK